MGVIGVGDLAQKALGLVLSSGGKKKKDNNGSGCLSLDVSGKVQRSRGACNSHGGAGQGRARESWPRNVSPGLQVSQLAAELTQSWLPNGLQTVGQAHQAAIVLLLDLPWGGAGQVRSQCLPPSWYWEGGDSEC